MPKSETCRACLGTGETQVPTFREKIINHIIFTRSLDQITTSALVLSPAEIEELAEALAITEAELTPAEVSGDAGEV